MLEINYEEIVKKYNSDIFTKTRAFVSDQEYLKFWVPSEDSLEGVLNLIESLKESNELEFKIILSRKILLNNVEKLNSTLNKFSSFSSSENPDDYIYQIKIHKDKFNNFFRKKSKLNLQIISERSENKEVKNLPLIFEKNIIKDYYIKEIENFDYNKFNNFFETKENFNQDKEKSFQIFTSIILNYELTIKISIPNHYVVDCSFKKISSENHNWIEKFFEILKKVIQYKPLREVKDHAMIYLIDILRPKNIKSHGVIHPDNEGKIFYDLKLFFLSSFKSVDKGDKIFNRHYKSLSSEWKNLEIDKQKEIINKELIEFSGKNNFSRNLDDISLKRIEKNFKVVLNVSEEFLNRQKNKNYLLELEEKVKRNVDFRLEIFITMKLDANKLRSGKSFKDFKE